MTKKECACGHPRLLHDSWGCKVPCGCGVSIIYLTPLLPTQPTNSEEDRDLILEGIRLGVEQDRVQESHVKRMLLRMLEDRS